MKISNGFAISLQLDLNTQLKDLIAYKAAAGSPLSDECLIRIKHTWNNVAAEYHEKKPYILIDKTTDDICVMKTNGHPTGVYFAHTQTGEPAMGFCLWGNGGVSIDGDTYASLIRGLAPSGTEALMDIIRNLDIPEGPSNLMIERFDQALGRTVFTMAAVARETAEDVASVVGIELTPEPVIPAGVHFPDAGKETRVTIRVPSESLVESVLELSRKSGLSMTQEAYEQITNVMRVWGSGKKSIVIKGEVVYKEGRITDFLLLGHFDGVAMFTGDYINSDTIEGSGPSLLVMLGAWTEANKIEYISESALSAIGSLVKANSPFKIKFNRGQHNNIESISIS